MINLDADIIFLFVLGIFTLGAAILATVSVINVVRLRNVRLSWKTGKLGGYPLFSTLFMVTVFSAGALAFYQGATNAMILAGLYCWLGFCWFTTSYFAAKRFITDNGIVKNVNEPSQTVAWHQICDFVETESNTHAKYIFIYDTGKYSKVDDLLRLELQVPNHKKEYFKKLISHKLGRRIRCYMKDDINIQQFKQL